MFQSNKNILTVGLNKTELDEYDKALILICGVLNVDLRKLDGKWFQETITIYKDNQVMLGFQYACCQNFTLAGVLRTKNMASIAARLFFLH